MISRRRLTGLAAFTALALSVVASNWAIRRYGFVPVWPGVKAPAAVYVAGLALGLRDVVQHTLGVRAALAAVVVGAALTFTLSPSLAVASGVAYLASEAVDTFVYTALRERGAHPRSAILGSGAVSLVVDSLLFLTLSGIGLGLLTGQIIGKTWATLAGVATLPVSRRVAAA